MQSVGFVILQEATRVLLWFYAASKPEQLNVLTSVPVDQYPDEGRERGKLKGMQVCIGGVWNGALYSYKACLAFKEGEKRQKSGSSRHSEKIGREKYH